MLFFLLVLLAVSTSAAVVETKHIQLGLHRKLLFDEKTSVSREGDGVWYVKMRVGTPPQDFTAIIDTGSSTIAGK